MDKEEFENMYSPRFGDVVFSKEPTKPSRAIRVAQAVKMTAQGKRSNGNFSHAAFVIDGSRIIHSVGGKGVHTTFFYDFFNKNMEYQVLRPPRVPEVKEINATYYVGQKYDKRIDLVKRFISIYFPKNTQVCSTLVAQTLVNYGIAQIAAPESVSPIKLHGLLLAQGWSDVTEKYSYLLSLGIGGGEVGDFLRVNHDLLDNNLKSMQQSKKEFPVFLDVILTFNALQIKWANEMGDEELVKHLEAELKDLEKIEEIEFAFHDTDDLSPDLFKK